MRRCITKRKAPTKCRGFFLAEVRLGNRGSIVGAGAGVIAVPPIGTAGISSLPIKPSATSVAITITVIAWPPADTGYEDIVVEAVMEAVMDKVIMVMAMPVPIPTIAFTIPAIARTATPCIRTNAPAGKMAALPTTGTTYVTTTGEARTTHAATKVTAAHAAKVAATHSTKVAAAAHTTTAKAMRRVSLLRSDRSKEQHAGKSGYCNC
jgi:hypothetical protein